MGADAANLCHGGYTWTLVCLIVALSLCRQEETVTTLQLEIRVLRIFEIR